MNSPENLAVSSATPTPTGFYSQKLWGSIFLVLEPWAVQAGLGQGSLAPKVSLSNFIPTRECAITHFTALLPLHTISCLLISLPISVTLPLLPVWVNVVSLNPWLSNFHTAWFSDSSGCYLFWDIVVILSVAERGGKVCLPMPPSWLEVLPQTFLWMNQFSNN